MSKRSRHIRTTLRRGPTEAAYAFFRARRRRRNVADEEPELRSADLDLDDLEANAEVLRAYAALDALEVRSVQWFLPWFHLVTGGGVHTALRLAAHFADRHAAVQRFCIYDREDAADARDVAGKAAAAFPALAAASFEPAGAALGYADAAIATTWESAFSLVRFRRARAKFFLVQDWEPDFHPAGSTSAMLGEAARLGIPGLVNTPGLADAYRAAGNPAVAFTPAVDPRYGPPQGRRDPGAPVRVFFYGRPATPRNAFGLGLAALRRVKARFGERVEIVCAGEDWSPGQYGVADVLENRGQLEDLDEVAALYRSCDVGIAFMLTRHPSYQPLEFMASGMATVSNRNPHTAWLLRHEENALLAEPLPALVAEQVARLVEDPGLRERLAAAGRAEVAGRSWDDELERVWGAMTKSGPAFE
jgi:glycosyltransferase involved in cell wall biosynthesis